MRYMHLTARVLAVVLAGAAPATAAEFVVTTMEDAVDAAPGDGVCATAAGACSLRAAVQESNALSGPDVIRLPAGRFHLALSGRGEDAAATGDLDLTDDLVIIGAGAGVSVVVGGPAGSPIGLDRVFHVRGSIAVLIQTLTIRNGFAHGAGLLNDGAEVTIADCVIERNTSGDLGHGGGIVNQAGSRLLMNRTTLRRNSAFDAGGLQNSGTAEIANSTIAENFTTVTGPVPPDEPVVIGGGILNSGRLTLENSTLSGNSALNGGAALYNHPGGIAHLRSVTVANNSSRRPAPSDAIRNFGTMRAINTIVANNSPINCVVPLSGSDGFNLDDDNTCGLTAVTDLHPADARLGPLADNAGATHTHAPRGDSPAIDSGGGCPALDQRGSPRPIDGDRDGTPRCDIGSVEVSPLLFFYILDLRLVDFFFIEARFAIPRGHLIAATKGKAPHVVRFEVSYFDMDGKLVTEQKFAPLSLLTPNGVPRQGRALVTVMLQLSTAANPQRPVKVSASLQPRREPSLN